MTETRLTVLSRDEVCWRRDATLATIRWRYGPVTAFLDAAAQWRLDAAGLALHERLSDCMFLLSADDPRALRLLAEQFDADIDDAGVLYRPEEPSR